MLFDLGQISLVNTRIMNLFLYDEINIEEPAKLGIINTKGSGEYIVSIKERWQAILDKDQKVLC